MTETNEFHTQDKFKNAAIYFCNDDKPWFDSKPMREVVKKNVKAVAEKYPLSWFSAYRSGVCNNDEVRVGVGNCVIGFRHHWPWVKEITISVGEKVVHEKTWRCKGELDADNDTECAEDRQIVSDMFDLFTKEITSGNETQSIG